MALVRKSNEKIEDFGEKIGGARKDLWKDRGLNLTDFDGLDEREYSVFVTKDNIWPLPDYKALVENGMHSACSYYLKFVRDKLPAKAVSNSKEDAKNYIEFVSIYKDVITGLNDISELNRESIRSKLELEAENKGFRYLRYRPYVNVLRAILLSSREFERLITESKLQNFPDEFKGALKGLSIESYGYNDNKTYRLIQGKYYASDKKFNSFDDAFNYANEELIPLLLEKKKTKRKTRTVNVVRPQLQGIKRTGKDVRKGKDITGDDLLNDFKFRGGEFGNWNTQDDRQACLNYAYDAFIDLASVLRAPTEFISLGGYKDKKLAIAFGARGTGSASAHYEPTNVVINLTKMKGAGSLAHEWGHALDDFLGIKCANTSMLTSLGRYHRNPLKHKEVVDKFEELISIMQQKPATDEEVLEHKNKEVEKYKKYIERWTESLPNFYGGTVDQSVTIKEAREKFLGLLTQEAFDELVRTYKDIVGRLPSKETRDAVSNYLRFLGYVQESIEKYNTEGSFEHTSMKETLYYTSAKNLDKYRAKPYYSTKVEMFARAFESYIEDVVKSRGNKSDYLVHSTLNTFYDDLYPYPQGEERELINQKMKEFLLLVVDTFAELQPEDEPVIKPVVDNETEDKGKFKLTLFKELCKDKGLKVDFGKSPIENDIYTINFTEGYIKFIKVPVFNDITEDNHNADIYCGEKDNIKEGYGWDKELDYEDFVNSLVKLEEIGNKTIEDTTEKFQITVFKELCKNAGLKVDFGTTPEENDRYIINFKNGYVSYIKVAIMLSKVDKDQIVDIHCGVTGTSKLEYIWGGILDYQKLVDRLVEIEKEEVQRLKKVAEQEKIIKAADGAKDVLNYNKLDIPKELSPIQKEFQSMLMAAQDVRDLARKKGLRVKLNEENATITLYHGTSKENANKIKRTGFNPKTTFSHAKTKTGYDANGPMYYARTVNKNGDVLVIHVDARAIRFIESTGEFITPNGLIFKGGVWKERESDRPIERQVKPVKQEVSKEIKPIVAKGLTDYKELRNILNDYVGQLNIKLAGTPSFGHILPILRYNLTVKYQINIPIIVRVIPEDKTQGNSKVWAYDTNYNLNIQGTAEDRKKAEGLVEGVVEGILAKKGYTGLKRSMLREGLTYMICKTYNLDVRTYLMSKEYERLLSAGDKSVNNFINQTVNLYKELIRYFMQ